MPIKSMTQTARCLLIMAAMLAPATIATARAAEPMGTWFTADRESQVRITNCGGALCGSLVWLKQPTDPATGRPKTDKNNADASKRNRPLLGEQIVLCMRPSGPNAWSGSVYNAEDGKTYDGSFTLISATSAALKGCVLGGLICKSQTWTRAK
jgi:uncharacterized protein (DUF2147 family)